MHICGIWKKKTWYRQAYFQSRNRDTEVENKLWIKGAAVMSDSVRPHRWQPTRFPCPWDSPGKNTGVGCHCLLQCMKVKSEREVTQSCPTLSHPMDYSPRGSSIHGIFQVRVSEWGAITNGVRRGRMNWEIGIDMHILLILCMCVCVCVCVCVHAQLLSHVWLFVTL